MRTVNQIAKEGTGVYRLTRGDVGEIIKACKAKKVPMVSPWNRKKKASK